MQKPIRNALITTKEELVTTRNVVAEQRSKIASLQYDIEKLRLAAQQAGEVNALRAEVVRLQHLAQQHDQFNADLEAFRRLKTDVHNLETFRKHKIAILQYLKLFPKVKE